MEKTDPASHHFHPLMRPSQGHGDSRESRNPGGGVGAASFHTLVCRHQPAWAIGRKACPGLRSGIDSATGLRHQPPSPEQRQPRVEREMYRWGLSPANGTPASPPGLHRPTSGQFHLPNATCAGRWSFPRRVGIDELHPRKQTANENQRPASAGICSEGMTARVKHDLIGVDPIEQHDNFSGWLRCKKGYDDGRQHSDQKAGSCGMNFPYFPGATTKVGPNRGDPRARDD